MPASVMSHYDYDYDYDYDWFRVRRRLRKVNMPILVSTAP